MGQSATAEAFAPLFDTAHGALVFAFNFSVQCYDRPMMNRMAAPGVGSGKGLVGIDGAAQAGMVRAEVHALGKLAEAIIIARIAPRSVPCNCRSACCAGHKPNKEWADAIAYLADHVRTTALAGCTSNGLLRREYVVRYFTRKESRIGFESLAEKHNLARNTVSAHAGKVAFLLGGAQAKKGQAGVPGLENAAMDAIEDRLRAIGMVFGA
ncbi:hypothetical protein Dsui_0191 [Azospira oryzae PS]|uniref:DNA-binding protein n=1 Tax=Azospira oryzae (strain ATCC BAA-33 / DSM 13638 / PS) TaxID=640081 RepID=G8QMN1_AZOOP|nr:hypothetical protein [Azospira oryzae]AEV24611.1 hypothetical protein Dsui_0191 [Azospira oryzae PS]